MNYQEELKYRETMWSKLSGKDSLRAVSWLHWNWNADRPSGEIVLAHPFNYSYSKYIYAAVLQLNLSVGAFIYYTNNSTRFQPPTFSREYWGTEFDCWPAPEGVKFVAPFQQCQFCDQFISPTGMIHEQKVNPLEVVSHWSFESREKQSGIVHNYEHQFGGRVIEIGCFDPENIPSAISEVISLPRSDTGIVRKHCGKTPSCPGYNHLAAAAARLPVSRGTKTFFTMVNATQTITKNETTKKVRSIRPNQQPHYAGS